MSRDECRELLLCGATLYGDVFHWSKHSLDCESGCCESYFGNIEETLDSIKILVNYDVEVK